MHVVLYVTNLFALVSCFIEVYGFPLTNAIYRTNHGYDPVTQDNYQWYGYHAYEDSKRRLLILLLVSPELFVEFIFYT